MLLTAIVCALAFTGCNKSTEPAADAKAEAPAAEAKADDAKADEAKADDAKADEAKADDAKADEAKADEAKADEAKADEAKADDAEPSIEDVCKHTASCIEDSNIDQCIAMAKNDDSATKCPAEFKAMQKCMVAASCDDIKAGNACKAENDALLACKGNSAKE